MAILKKGEKKKEEKKPKVVNFQRFLSKNGLVMKQIMFLIICVRKEDWNDQISNIRLFTINPIKRLQNIGMAIGLRLVCCFFMPVFPFEDEIGVTWSVLDQSK